MTKTAIMRIFFIVAAAFVLEACAYYLIKQRSFLLNVFGSSDAFWEMSFLNNNRFVYTKPKNIIEFDEMCGWKNKKQIHVAPPEFAFTFSTDTLGCRVIPNHSHSGKNKKILLIGDSFTACDEVNDDETWAFFLQNKLNNADVMNAGVIGYSQTQMLLQLKELLAKLQPHEVILGFVNTDMERNPLTFNGAAKPAITKTEKRFVLSGIPAPTPEKVISENPVRLALYQFIRFLFRKKETFTNKHNAEVTAYILSEMAKTVQKHHAQFKVLLIPTSHDYKNINQTSDFFKDVTPLFSKLSINYLNLENDFKAVQNISKYETYGGHWNKDMNKLIGEKTALWFNDFSPSAF